MQRFTFISSRNWFFWVDKKQLLSNFFVKWATFGQLLKSFGANFERYPSNLCKSLDTTEISFQLWSITAPLSDLTRNGQPNKVEWGEAQEKAYQTIKSYLFYVSPIKLKPISYGQTLPAMELVQYWCKGTMRNSSWFVMQARNCQVWSATTLHSRKSA